MAVNLRLITLPGACALTASLVLGGCASPDPEARFDEYLETLDSGTTDTGVTDTGGTDTGVDPDTGGTDTGGDAGACIERRANAEGVWFMAISASIDRENPLYLEVTVTQDGDTLDFSFQPLSTDIATDPETFEQTPRENPRQPVGDPVVVTGVTYEADGSFELLAENLVVSLEANPITPSQITGDVELYGSFLNDDTSCGRVGGTVQGTTTVPLSNPQGEPASDFAMFRLTDEIAATDFDPVLYTCGQVGEVEPPCDPAGGGGGGGEECIERRGTAGGVWFMAISASIDRENPLYVEVTIDQDGDTLDFSFQPLSTDIATDPETFEQTPRENPRQAVGDPVVVTGVTFEADGTFEVTATDLVVSRDANPITPSQITGNVEFYGTILNDDVSCGRVGGTVQGTTTVPLSNSQGEPASDYAMFRIPDGGSATDFDPVQYTCGMVGNVDPACDPVE